MLVFEGRRGNQRQRHRILLIDFAIFSGCQPLLLLGGLLQLILALRVSFQLNKYAQEVHTVYERDEAGRPVEGSQGGFPRHPATARERTVSQPRRSVGQRAVYGTAVGFPAWAMATREATGPGTPRPPATH